MFAATVHSMPLAVDDMLDMLLINDQPERGDDELVERLLSILIDGYDDEAAAAPAPPIDVSSDDDDDDYYDNNIDTEEERLADFVARLSVTSLAELYTSTVPRMFPALTDYSRGELQRTLLRRARGRYDLVFGRVHAPLRSATGRRRLLEFPVDTLCSMTFDMLQARGQDGLSSIEVSRVLAVRLDADPPYRSTRLSTLIDTLRSSGFIHMRYEPNERFPRLYIA